MIIGLCERFHVLPSAVMAESSELLSLMTLADMARPKEPSLA